jgi:hypothetical protein
MDTDLDYEALTNAIALLTPNIVIADFTGRTDLTETADLLPAG